MRHEWVVDYFYEGQWIEFAAHITLAEAKVDEAIMAHQYKTRVRRIHGDAAEQNSEQR